MAKNCNVLSIRSNMIEENRKILNELRNQRQVYNYNKDDLNKLCEKLNSRSGSRIQHTVSNSSPSLYNKQVSDYIYGPMQRFPPGSWWGIRMDCARDLVHNSFDSDIQFGPAGATSVCTSQANMKGDIDLGDYLTLTGQRFSEGAANDDPLILNYKNQVPIRLIRSYNLSNPFAPRTGYRYDGLYVVIAYWIGINSDSTKHNKFALVRLLGQEPSPWQRTMILNDKNSDVTLLKSNNSHCSLLDAHKNKNHLRDHDTSEKDKSNLDKESKQLIARNAKIVEQPKNMRHSITIKSHSETDCQNTVNNACLPYENSSHFSIHESKAQNTNISIRTDLYDSSHNTQPDGKKNTLLLPKTMKAIMPHRRFAQHSESISISKVSAVNKFNVKINPSENNTVPEMGTDANGRESIQINNVAESDSSELTDQPKCTESKRLTKKRTCNGESYTVQFSKRACHMPSSSKSLLNEEENDVPGNSENLIPILQKSAQNQKSLESLDSLTPDKILNLIDKEKCHPLSQFLIDSMIGLKPEESLKLRSCNSLRSQNDTKNKSSATKNRTQGKITTKYAISDRCKLNRHSKAELSKKTADKSRVERYRRILRNKDTKNDKLIKKKRSSPRDNTSAIELKPKRVYKKHNSPNNSSGSCESNGVPSSSNVNVRNNKSQATLNDKQNSKYSGQTAVQIRKNVKNMDSMKHRKQRREITNLIIDAKITPLARGPRNRRLRSIGNSCGKKLCCDASFKSFFCSTEKRKVRMKRSSYKTDFRKKSKLSKSSDCLKRMRRRQSTTYRSTVGLNSHGIRSLEALGVQMMKKRKNDDHQSTNTPVNKQHSIALGSSTSVAIRNSRPRKALSDRINQEGENSCCVNKWNRICCVHDKLNIVKPPAADAMVQCSFPSEFEDESLQTKDSGTNPRNDTNDPKVFFKMEKTPSEETCSELIENKCQTESAFHPENEKSSNKRTSAFVPVGTFDSYLRIARLRSLGFKPIGASPADEEDVESAENNAASESKSGSCSRKVTERDAQEVYSKYSNEDGSLVGYLDEDLSYQDIEDEVVGKRMMSVSVGDERANSTETLEYKRVAGRESRNAIEHDLDLPWHGWKKVVTKEESFWVGW